MAADHLTRVLAAANGSEVGQHAVQFAERLAHRAQASYRVLGVATNGVPGYPLEAGPEPMLLSRDRVSSHGIPGIEIARAASDWGADLVVIGRRPRVDPSEALGSTIEVVLRRLEKPCLLIPPGVDEVHRMLLALDGTLRGLGTIAWAAAFAELFSLSLSAVHVAPDPFSTAPEQRLRHALGGFPSLGTSARLEVRTGLPVENILAEAERARADLLVVGVRRGGPLGDAGSGHVGRDLLRRAPIAILTVPI